jgi:uncharacterized protein YlaI
MANTSVVANGEMNTDKPIGVFSCSTCGEHFIAARLRVLKDGSFDVTPVEYQRAAGCFVCGERNKRS